MKEQEHLVRIGHSVNMSSLFEQRGEQDALWLKKQNNDKGVMVPIKKYTYLRVRLTSALNRGRLRIQQICFPHFIMQVIRLLLVVIQDITESHWDKSFYLINLLSVSLCYFPQMCLLVLAALEFFFFILLQSFIIEIQSLKFKIYIISGYVASMNYNKENIKGLITTNFKKYCLLNKKNICG